MVSACYQSFIVNATYFTWVEVWAHKDVILYLRWCHCYNNAGFSFYVEIGRDHSNSCLWENSLVVDSSSTCCQVLVQDYVDWHRDADFFVIIGALNCRLSDAAGFKATHRAHPLNCVSMITKHIAGLFPWVGVKCFVILTFIPKREQLCIANCLVSMYYIMCYCILSQTANKVSFHRKFQTPDETWCVRTNINLIFKPSAKFIEYGII